MTERLGDMWDMADVVAPEQLEEYVQLMRDITHGVGKGVKRRRTTRTVNGTEIVDVSPKEFWLPGTLTDWSIPDRKFRTHQERCRTYSASYLAAELGQGVAQLIVLENDSKRFVDFLQRPKYHTSRNMYRLNWTEGGDITTATMLRGEFVSDVYVEANIRGTEIYEPTLWLDHEETEPELFRMLEPDSVSQVEFDGLLRRTDEYGKEHLAAVEAARAKVA